ncbi:MAG: C4-type zinc ribbon domain-containing protein [Acidimicrobiales bacterium]|jgi:hypothetical protein
MNAFEDLLKLQEHDTRIDQLRHRLSTLPERAARDAHLEQVAHHDEITGALAARRDELARSQRRIEDEVATLAAKVEEVDRKLYSGTVTSPRELQALQDDLDSLRRRQRELEDEILELMEQIEPLDQQLAARAAERADLDRQGVELEAALAQVESGIDAELSALQAERAAIEQAIPADLLAHYENLRRRLHGIAVARLVGGQCGGCHLSLSAVELDRIKHEPPDALVHCEECGRLLIR